VAQAPAPGRHRGGGRARGQGSQRCLQVLLIEPGVAQGVAQLLSEARRDVVQRIRPTGP
jgi:hypothetical protein